MVDRTIAVRLRAEVADFKRNMADAAKAVDKNVSAVDTLSNQVGLLGGALTGFAALAVTRFAAFDKQMSSVQAATRTTGAELDSLRQAAIRAGADTAFSATEAAAGIEELAKAGVSTADILGGGLNGALSLAAAGELEVGEAAEIAAVALKQFNLDGGDVGHVADLLAAGAGKAVGSVSDMSQALNQAGLVAAGTGLNIEETTAGLSAFAAAGLIGSDAGTSFKTMLQVLSAPSATAKKQMDELGISAYDAQGEFVGLEGFAGQLKTSLEDLTPAQRNSALATIFGADAVRAANVLYSEGADGIAEWTDAVDAQGYAAEQAAIQNDNLLGDLERLGGSFDTVLIQSGSGANGALRTLVQGAEDLVDALGRLPGPVLTVTTLIAGGGGLALLGVAGLGKLAVATVDTRNAMMDLGLMSEKTAGKVGKIGKAAGALGAVAAAGGAAVLAMDALTDASDKTAVGVEQTISALRGIEDQNINSLFQGLGGDVDNLAQGLDLLVGPNIEKFGSAMNTIFAGGMLQDQVKDTAAQFENIGEALAGMVAAGDAEAAAEQFDIIAQAAAAQGISIDEVKRLMPAYAEALAAAKNAAEGATGATEGLPPALDAEALAAERATQATESYAKALEATADPVSTYESILARKEQAERETAEATAAATDDASDSWEDYADDVSVTTADLIKDWQRQAREAAAFEENLAVIAAAGGQAMADELRAKGPEVAGSVAAVIAEAGPKQQASAIAAHAAATGGSISQQMADTLVAQGWRLQRAVDGTIEAAHPKKDITVTVTDAGSADRVKGEIASIPTSKTVTITTIRQVWGGEPTGTGTVLRNSAAGSRLPGFPTGGRLPGRPPSNPMEDNLLGVDGAGIPRVRVRSREWVVREPAADYYGDRLMSAINAKAIPREALAGLTGLASGGAVQAARSDVLRTQRALEAARRSHRRVHTDSSEERWRRAQEVAETARDRYDRLREEASSLRTDLRRGNIRDQVTGGLSGARGATDQMRDLADSGDLSRRGSQRLAGSADKAESALTALYRQADRLDKKVADATENFEKWKGIADGVSSSISGGFSLGGVTGGTDPWSGAERAATGSQLLSAAKAYEAKAKTLVLRLQSLRKAGYGTAILQEVAAQGVEGGTAMADALLTLSPAEMKSLQSSMSEIDRYGDRAGAEAAGGNLSSSARAKELAEAQVAAIDKQIGKWAEWIGSVLAKSLGVQARANGGPVKAGHPYLVNEDTPNSELFIPSQSGYVLNNRQMGSLSAGGPSVTHNWNIKQYNPVAEAPSVTAAKTARQLANVGRR